MAELNPGYEFVSRIPDRWWCDGKLHLHATLALAERCDRKNRVLVGTLGRGGYVFDRGLGLRVKGSPATPVSDREGAK